MIDWEKLLENYHGGVCCLGAEGHITGDEVDEALKLEEKLIRYLKEIKPNEKRYS